LSEVTRNSVSLSTKCYGTLLCLLADLHFRHDLAGIVRNILDHHEIAADQGMRNMRFHASSQKVRLTGESGHHFP
jgi:hypothetical protein